MCGKLLELYYSLRFEPLVVEGSYSRGSSDLTSMDLDEKGGRQQDILRVYI